MASEVRRAVYKITAMKDGCVFKTKFICDIWISLDVALDQEADHNEIAKQFGGDMLCTPSNFNAITDLRKIKS